MPQNPERETTITERIKTAAIGVLLKNVEGVRYTQLINTIKAEHPEFEENTIVGAIWNLDATIPGQVYKPARGLFKHTTYRDENSLPQQSVKETVKHVLEEDFYEPFAKYLRSKELCTRVISLGRNKFGGKWGTPDVIGILEPKKSDIIKWNTEIISAEIKTDTSQVITAFGQACSYKLFSHTTYLLIPKDSSDEDKERIESLCNLSGVGLVLFNNDDPQNPQFEIRVTPRKHEPDLFYTNECVKKIENELFG